MNGVSLIQVKKRSSNDNATISIISTGLIQRGKGFDHERAPSFKLHDTVFLHDRQLPTDCLKREAQKIRDFFTRER